ncbi:MAG: CinA family protein [Pseudomonadota bacterium]
MSDLAEKFIHKLKKKGLMLTTAESCTGGLIASAITAKAGSSAVFDRSFVTYSNDAKIEMLGVDQKILEEHGAVSTLTAEAMVKGALDNSKANLVLSVTGIAGPDGGTDQKPVGLVYIGYGLRGDLVKVARHDFDGNRETIRLKAVKQAMLHGMSLL